MNTSRTLQMSVHNAALKIGTERILKPDFASRQPPIEEDQREAQMTNITDTPRLTRTPSEQLEPEAPDPRR
jgi:hypothetical protein